MKSADLIWLLWSLLKTSGWPLLQQSRLTIGLKRKDEFRKDAVRIALTSGLTRRQVADDLGVGMSMLNKWITANRETDVVSKED